MVAALPIIGWGLCKGVPMSYKMQNIETSTLQAGKFWNHHNSNSYTGVRSCNYSIHITWETTWINLHIWSYICCSNSLCHMSRYQSIELIYHNMRSIFEMKRMMEPTGSLLPIRLYTLSLGLAPPQMPSPNIAMSKYHNYYCHFWLLQTTWTLHTHPCLRKCRTLLDSPFACTERYM